MTIEAVEERFCGLVKKVSDLGPDIEEYRQGPYQEAGNPSFTYIPRPPRIVTRFEDKNKGKFSRRVDILMESAEARTPDVVVKTVFECDSENLGRVTSAKIVRREKINDAKLTSGNWWRRTTWRWRP